MTAPEKENLSVEQWDALVDAGELALWTADEALALKVEVHKARTRKSGNLTGRTNSDGLVEACRKIIAYKCKTPARRKPVIVPSAQKQGYAWRD